MQDLIERQAAIDEVVAWLKDRMTDGKNGKPLTERLKDLLPAQPTYTDAEIQKMQDLEKAQIEKAYQLGYEEGKRDAQPEIVMCKDCKYCDRGIDEDGNPFLKCLGRVYGGTQEDDFCSHSERRTDERSD